MPSRVRSPTPQKTDLPPWPFCTLLISSMMTTVLPTPAPPKRPILPPFTNGAIRSMTLMPVSKTCGLGLEVHELGRLAGGSATARRRPESARRRPPARPGRSGSGPAPTSPTGTVIGRPVSTAFMPRITPSVVLMATARTWFWPMCCCTSATRRTACAAGRVLDQQRVVDLGQLTGLELHVEHRSDDLDDRAGLLRYGCSGHVLFLSVFRFGSLWAGVAGADVDRPVRRCRPSAYPCSAAAPPTISAISCVIAAWRWRL